MKYLIFYLIPAFLFMACNNSHKAADIDTVPEVTQVDKKYADVYKMLEGSWEGEFEILEDPNPVNASEVELKNLTIGQVQSSKLKTINKIKVKQTYISESPYFQRVTIEDFYPDSGKKEISKGVNKIENGQMLCIVNKPNETVIHQGILKNENTIIWHSNQKSPQKIEYFYETVTDNFYEIIGYGYYEGDDVNLSPRLWFYGKYKRM